MTLSGATLSQGNPVLYNSDSLFVSEEVLAKSVLKVGEQVCYFSSGYLRVLDGPAYKIDGGVVERIY
jgi:hypothetical protein